MEGGLQRLAGKAEHDNAKELKKKIAKLERSLGKKTYELDLGKSIAGLGVSQRVAWSRDKVAEGHPVATVAMTGSA